MNFKKVTTIILAGILVTALSACGNKNSNIDNPSVNSAETSSENAINSSIDSINETTDTDNTLNESEEKNNCESSETEASVSEKVTEKPAIVDKTWEYKVDVSWIDTEKPMVALSFDDGPVYTTGDNSTAIRIQNAIADNGMHATFFYWGTSLNGITQKEIERAYGLGFELGNHTKTHADLSKLLTSEDITKEVEYMDKKLAEIAPDQEHFLVRPPYLAVNQRVKDTVIAPLISCGLDTKDWNGASTEKIIATIKDAVENDTLDGQIVLMHETYVTTAEAVEYLVPYLKDQGYQVVSISEMYCARGKTMTGGKVYSKCAK